MSLEGRVTKLERSIPHGGEEARESEIDWDALAPDETAFCLRLCEEYRSDPELSAVSDDDLKELHGIALTYRKTPPPDRHDAMRWTRQCDCGCCQDVYQWREAHGLPVPPSRSRDGLHAFRDAKKAL